MILKLIHLFIYLFIVPPSLKAVKESGKISTRKGGTVTLECKAGGNPVPSIFWKKVCKHVFSYSCNLFYYIIKKKYFLFPIYFCHNNWKKTYKNIEKRWSNSTYCKWTDFNFTKCRTFTSWNLSMYC